jgi:hypothetical protein
MSGYLGRVVLSGPKVRPKMLECEGTHSGLGAGLEFPMSSTTFHEPFFCFFQIDVYFP